MVHKLQFEQTPVVSRFKCVTSQLIACMASNLLLLDLGMSISFSTIVIPELLNSEDGLSLTNDEASWFGSIAFLAQPLGALFSGPIVDYLGRKKANFIVNIPHLIAWILMYYAWNVPVLFIANGLLGLGAGVMESPINSYVGEVTEASVRGALCTVTQLFTSLGIFIMYFLGIVVPWRQAALISLIPPIASMLWVLSNLVPETPIWLLVRNRDKEALKSLRFLRGWTSAEDVREEFESLAEYSKMIQQCVLCQSEGQTKGTSSCQHGKLNIFKRFALKFRYVMLTKETLRPFSLIMCYFAFLVMSGLAPIKPNMVNVCDALGMARGGKEAVLMVGVITLLASVIVVAFIKILGKRKLAISAMLGTAVSALALCIYAKINLNDSIFSYDPETFPAEKSYVPLAFFYMLTTFTGFAIPWVLFGEVFPFRSRATAQGIAAAGNYVIIFVASKTFINLEQSIHLWGTFFVYALFALIGTLYLYFYLPETEGKTLQEIENFYNGESRIFADDCFINCIRRKEKDTML